MVVYYPHDGRQTGSQGRANTHRQYAFIANVNHHTILPRISADEEMPSNSPNLNSGYKQAVGIAVIGYV
jgi:hypothetical protein